MTGIVTQGAKNDLDSRIAMLTASIAQLNSVLNQLSIGGAVNSILGSHASLPPFDAHGQPEGGSPLISNTTYKDAVGSTVAKQSFCVWLPEVSTTGAPTGSWIQVYIPAITS